MVSDRHESNISNRIIRRPSTWPIELTRFSRAISVSCVFLSLRQIVRNLGRLGIVASLVPKAFDLIDDFTNSLGGFARGTRAALPFSEVVYALQRFRSLRPPRQGGRDKFLDQSPLNQRPNTRRNKVDAQSGRDFEKEHPHEDRHDHHHLLRHPRLLVVALGMSTFCWMMKRAIV